MPENPAPADHPIHDLLARRWSPRAFDAKRPVERAALASLLEAARWAPSCANDQPWRFLVVDRMRDAAAWQRAFDCLDAGNQEWVRSAPVIVASFAAAGFRNGKPNRWGPHDVGLATQNLLLQATALGLAAHAMGGYRADALHAAFAVPTGFAVQAMIAIGHPGDPAQLTEKNRTRETAPRARQPLASQFFESGWGAGFAG